MADEIHIDASGKASYIFAANEGAGWHGLGTPIDPAIARDPVAMAAAASIDYRVYKAPVQFMGSDGKLHTVPNREAVVREDTQETLEVMSGNKYKVPQPVEYLETFRDALAKNDLTISSVMALKGGRIIAVCARLTDSGISVLEMDPVDYYVCIGGGYDGTLSHFGFLGGQRTVCMNTLNANMATSKKGGKFYRMSHSSAYDGAALGAAIGLAGVEVRTQAAVFNRLASHKMTAADVAGYFCAALDVDPATVNAYGKDGKPLMSTKTRNQLNALADAYLAGPGATLESAAGTAWGALNAVTYYVDHKSTVRDTALDGADNARLASAQFGGGATVKARALALAMTAAGITSAELVAA
jgi:phage/plasmid-like protein (TIGR03299 family)